MSVKTEPCLCRCVRLDQGSPERISFPTSSPHLTSSSAKALLSCVSSRPRGKDIHLFGERTQGPKADPSSREDTESQTYGFFIASAPWAHLSAVTRVYMRMEINVYLFPLNHNPPHPSLTRSACPSARRTWQGAGERLRWREPEALW